MKRAHKIRLNPTPQQLNYFFRAAGIARFAWNWALARYKEIKDEGGTVHWNEIKKEFRAKIDAEFPFCREVTKCAAEQALADLKQAIDTYYKVKELHPNKKIRFPKPRKRSKKIGSFGLNNDQFKLNGHEAWIPRLGWVNLAEELRFAGKICTGRVKEAGGYWYLIVTVEVTETNARPLASGSIGIDFGLSRFATLSNGEVCETQAYFRSNQRKLKKLQRGLARKKIGSHRRERWKRKIRRHHGRIRNLRHDFTHKFSTGLAHKFALICVEDLNLAGMSSSLNLGKSVCDAAIGGTILLLESKAIVLQKVDRFFPSSKQCHCCGWINAKLTLSDRRWQCAACGALQDRDLNAAINIKFEGQRVFNAGSGYVGVTHVD